MKHLPIVLKLNNCQWDALIIKDAFIALVLIITILMLAGSLVGIGNLTGQTVNSNGSPQSMVDARYIDYLIVQMERARKTHADIVVDPAQYGNWIKAGVDHQEWVEIYDDVIEVLSNLK